MSTFEGGCQCGAVRYQSRSAPGFSLHCYCRQCQLITGAGHASQFALAASEVQVLGVVSKFVLTADSGNAVSSAFCPTCGSPVYKQSSGYPEVMFFHAVTLDEPAGFKAQQSVWISQMQPWDIVDDTLPKMP